MRETTKKLSLDVCYSVSLIENQGYQQNSSVAQDGDLSVCIWQISDQDCFWNFGFLKAGFAGDRIGIQVIVRTVRGFSLNHKHQSLNPFTPTSDQDRISPYNINTISSRQVMRIEKNVNHGIISWSNTKFSELTS